MSAMGDLVATHTFALRVLKAGAFDCQAYDIWLQEYDGAGKLARLEACEGLFPANSQVQQYAQLLVDQLNTLLSQGCSDELLLATYNYCDGLYEMIVDAMSDHATPDGAQSGGDMGMPPRELMAMAA